MKTITYHTEVTITKDREYSRSYGVSETVDYSLAMLKGHWLYLYGATGHFCGKKNVNVKHFHGFTGREIKEATFKRKLRIAENIAIESGVRKEAELKAKELEKKLKTILMHNNLEDRVAEVIESIRKEVTKDQIFVQLNKDFKLYNDICNEAVGLVGYDYAKHCGWTNVLTAIYNSY